MSSWHLPFSLSLRWDINHTTHSKLPARLRETISIWEILVVFHPGSMSECFISWKCLTLMSSACYFRHWKTNVSAAARPGFKLRQPSEMKPTIGFYWKLWPDNCGVFTALGYHQGGPWRLCWGKGWLGAPRVGGDESPGPSLCFRAACAGELGKNPQDTPGISTKSS